MLLLLHLTLPDIKEDIGVVIREGEKCEMNANSQGSKKDNDWPEFCFEIFISLTISKLKFFLSNDHFRF